MGQIEIEEILNENLTIKYDKQNDHISYQFLSWTYPVLLSLSRFLAPALHWPIMLTPKLDNVLPVFVVEPCRHRHRATNLY